MKQWTYYMIRMDDITADMNWDNFNRIRDIFERFQIIPLLGVVPDNQDNMLCIQEKKEEFWSILCMLQKQGWKIAQHGTNHVYVTEDKGILGINPFSEFAGQSYEIQYERISRGKHILEEHGIFTDIFMAPGHTYDENTIKALRECGFKTITDGLYFRPYVYKELLFVPCRLQGYRNRNGIDTLCLHSNSMLDKDIQELENFCGTKQEMIRPFSTDDVKQYAVKRNIIIITYEKLVLLQRSIKNRVSNSKRLSWYLKYTYVPDSKKRIIKRIICLPMLIIWNEKINRG